MPIVIAQNPATVKAAARKAASKLRFIDIGVNLTDPVFRGKYHGKRKHEDDMKDMFQRSKDAGLRSFIITGGSLSESRTAMGLAKECNVFCTTGCHPTRSAEFDKYSGGPEAYLKALDELIGENLRIPSEETGKRIIVAIGECGLDYDRLHFASKETQMKHFRPQLSLAKRYGLPLFLHSRSAHTDFVRILKEEGFGVDGGRGEGAKGGVVHSFTGTKEEMIELMDMGFHISFNGCSLKTAEQLEVIKSIRPERLLLETDAPWCSMTSTQASKPHLDGMPDSYRSLFFPTSCRPEKFVKGQTVKGRNEPCAIGGVAWVVHILTGAPFEKVVEKAWKNTVDLFQLEGLDLVLS